MEESFALPPKSNFSEWYHQIIQKAEIMDIRYPVKGLYIWFPFGFKLRQLVYSKIRELLDQTGHQEVYFPALIPETEFKKEKEHIKGFEDEVFWITHGGVSELDVKLILRPTSETAIYPIFKLWIRSHANLPLKVYQIVNTFRYETKHTRPLIRLREITSFKEAHTAHKDYKSAEKQVKNAINIYKKFYESLAIPYLITRRPEWDKFPGAAYTIAFDTVMPDGRSLQIGTVHHLADNFSKTFGITYEDVGGERKFVHQTCYGISERCIAALISVHGDNLGLVLPFDFAPVQIVIIPILYKGEEEKVLSFARKIYEKLKQKYRVVLDDSEERPGAKYYKWELKGAALRIEIGPKEAREGKVIVSFRDEREKIEINLEDLNFNKIDQWASEMRERLYEKAIEKFKQCIKYFENVNEISSWLKKGIALIHLCNSEKCGRALEENTSGSLLGWLEEVPSWINCKVEGKCIICKNNSKIAVLARTY